MYTQFFMTPVREAKQCFIEAFGGAFRRSLVGNLQTLEKHLPTESLPNHRKRRSLK